MISEAELTTKELGPPQRGYVEPAWTPDSMADLANRQGGLRFPDRRTRLPRTSLGTRRRQDRMMTLQRALEEEQQYGGDDRPHRFIRRITTVVA